jgi:hypothetical protein
MSSNDSLDVAQENVRLKEEIKRKDITISSLTQTIESLK